MSKQFNLEHRQAPNFLSGIATTVTVAGPSPDGMIHFIFYRDSARMTNEEFTATELKGPDGKIAGVHALAVEGGQHIENFREDVATISIPVATAIGLADVLSRFVKNPGMPGGPELKIADEDR